MSTIVVYHIPSDKDDPETPNAFKVAKEPSLVTLADIHALFPLPGRYHFRGKLNGIWLDLTESTPVPLPGLTGNKLVLKVLRLSWTAQSAPHARSSPEPVAPKIVDDFDAFFK